MGRVCGVDERGRTKICFFLILKEYLDQGILVVNLITESWFGYEDDPGTGRPRDGVKDRGRVGEGTQGHG
jgi:hypothetical protein